MGGTRLYWEVLDCTGLVWWVSWWFMRHICLYIGVQIFIAYGRAGSPEVVQEALADLKREEYRTNHQLMWIVVGIFVYICIYHQSVHVACNWHIFTQIKHALERNGAHLFAAFICYICLFLSNITVTILISYKKFSFPWIRANTHSQWHNIKLTIFISYKGHWHIREIDHWQI